MALAIGVWVVVYLAAHRSLDPVSQELAGGTALVCFGFAGYVLIRRVDRAAHAHPTTSRKVLVAVSGQEIDAETVRLACRMTDPQGGRLYGVHIIEVNRSLPLGAVLDDVVERGEQILDEVEKLAAAAQLPVETELVQARDTGPALVDEAVEWGADLIVMGLPYKRRFGEFNLGKTVPYVLKNANCRVMLFREHREHREASA